MDPWQLARAVSKGGSLSVVCMKLKVCAYIYKWGCILIECMIHSYPVLNGLCPPKGLLCTALLRPCPRPALPAVAKGHRGCACHAPIEPRQFWDCACLRNFPCLVAQHALLPVLARGCSSAEMHLHDHLPLFHQHD